MKKVLTFLALTSLVVLPIGLAVAADSAAPSYPMPNNAEAVWTTINAIVNWLFLILIIAAVVIIIIAAWTFLTAAGDADKTKSARNLIIYALIAIVVGFLAKAIVALIASIIGVNISGWTIFS